MEFKAVKLTKVTTKVAADGKTATFEGYGSVFENTDFYDDIVRRGAFKRSIDALAAAGTKCVMLWQHFYDQPIGIYTEMGEDAKGLKVVGEINLETERGREAYALLKQGAIRGLSIGYEAIKWFMENGKRILEECKLWEISLVTFPANEMALVDSVKALHAKQAAGEVQSLQFSKTVFPTIEEAKAWAEAHGHGEAIEDGEGFYRLQRFDTEDGTKGSHRTVEIEDGIEAIVCQRTRDAVLREIKRLVDLLDAPAKSHAPKTGPTEAPAQSHAAEVLSIFEEMKKLNAQARESLRAQEN